MSLSCFLCYLTITRLVFILEFFLLDLLEESWFPFVVRQIDSCHDLDHSLEDHHCLPVASDQVPPPSVATLRDRRPVGHHFAGFLVKHGHFDYFVADWFLGFDLFGPFEKNCWLLEDCEAITPTPKPLPAPTNKPPTAAIPIHHLGLRLRTTIFSFDSCVSTTCFVSF